MTKKNLIIVIILLAIIDMLAAGWYMSRRIEASGKSQNLFDQRDSTEVIAMADTVTSASQADVFDKLQHNTYYFIANSPNIKGDETSYYTSTKHVKVRWPKKVNGDDEFETLNKELIKKAFGNSQSKMKDARYVYLNTPNFNKPLGEGEYHSIVKAPRVYPVYGNVSQVLVYPYMTSQRLLVMEIDKVEYNGSTTTENTSCIHYDRQNHRVLSRLDILMADVDKESKLLKLINKKIDDLNKSRGENNQLQHAINVPAEVCCSKKGLIFQFKHGSISSSPIEILLDYDKVKEFMTKDFELLVDNNEGYWLYKENPKPEDINPRTAAPAVKSVVNHPAATKKTVTPKQAKKTVRPKRTKKTRYNGAKRRSGHYGRAARHHWSRRRR